MGIFIATHARLSFWIAMLPAFAGLIWGMNTLGSGAGLGLYALFVLWTVSAFVLINRQAWRLCRPAMEKLDRDCDPEPLLDLCRTVLRQNPDSLYFRVYESHALHLLGREEEARVSAELAEKNARLWKDPSLLLVWSASLPADDPRQERVAAALEKLSRRLNPQQQALVAQVQTHRQVLGQVTEAGSELEQPLLDRLEQAFSPREKVGANLALGAYYAIQGDLKGDPYLHYVLEHCNKLHGARYQAERLLCLLPVAPELRDRL